MESSLKWPKPSFAYRCSVREPWADISYILGSWSEPFLARERLLQGICKTMHPGPLIARLFGPYERHVAEAYKRLFADLDDFAARLRLWVSHVASDENQTKDSAPNGQNLRSAIDPAGSIRLILSTRNLRGWLRRGSGDGAAPQGDLGATITGIEVTPTIWTALPSRSCSRHLFAENGRRRRPARAGTSSCCVTSGKP